MPKLEWRPEYSVNQEKLDAQHRRLFDIHNRAYEEIVNSNDTSHLMSFINELLDYMEYHFVEEEQYMRELEYYDRFRHAAEHIKMKVHMETLIRFNPYPDDQDIPIKILALVSDKILRHVLIEDKKYSEFLCLEKNIPDVRGDVKC